MSTQRLILNNGTVLEDSGCGYSAGQLWCYIPHISMMEAFSLFSNSQNTSKIIFQLGESFPEDIVYEGFSHLGSMMEQENQIDIMLRREAG